MSLEQVRSVVHMGVAAKNEVDAIASLVAPVAPLVSNMFTEYMNLKRDQLAVEAAKAGLKPVIKVMGQEPNPSDTETE